MRVCYHPEFPKDILRFEADYARISPVLGNRFRKEIEEAIQAIKGSPGVAGHFIVLGSETIEHFRRRNLKTFPFFVMYGYIADRLVFGAIIPSRSDPLTWLTRFSS